MVMDNNNWTFKIIQINSKIINLEKKYKNIQLFNILEEQHKNITQQYLVWIGMEKYYLQQDMIKNLKYLKLTLNKIIQILKLNYKKIFSQKNYPFQIASIIEVKFIVVL